GEAVGRLSELGEDQAAVRADGDTARRAVRGRHDELCRDEAGRCNLANPAAPQFGKPEIAVRPRDDAVRLAVRRGNPKLRYAASHGNLTDLRPAGFRKPKVAVRARGDAEWRAGGGRDREFCNDPGR